jgi:hypothetical protein
VVLPEILYLLYVATTRGCVLDEVAVMKFWLPVNSNVCTGFLFSDQDVGQSGGRFREGRGVRGRRCRDAPPEDAPSVLDGPGRPQCVVEARVGRSSGKKLFYELYVLGFSLDREITV